MFVKNPEYFLTIAKERSISKAAEQLYLSQPYLSQYLAKTYLEVKQRPIYILKEDSREKEVENKDK